MASEIPVIPPDLRKVCGRLHLCATLEFGNGQKAKHSCYGGVYVPPFR